MADGWATYGVAPYTTTGAPGATAAAQRPQVAVVQAAAVNGVMTARLAGPVAGACWLVRRITVSTPGDNTSRRAYVYVGDPAPESLVMGTRSGDLDIAEEDPPLFVPEGTPLAVTWDAPNPSRALARIEYQEVY